MKTRLLIILTFIGLMIPISNTFATEPQIIPIFQPDVELIPDEKIIYGESFTIHAWLESYDNLPDDVGFHVDVLDPYHDQVDSTLWFAKQDFVYEFDTTHPAYNITKSGTYQIKIEKADLMQRTGIFLKTISFEILFPEPEQDESVSDNCSPETTLQDGVCVAKEPTSNSTSIGIWGLVIESPSKMPPLKQFKSGIPINEIQCNDSLVLVTKNNGHPACVTIHTKEKLLERGWTIMTPKERHNGIESILEEEDCVEFGRWLDRFAVGNFNESQLIFDFPVSEEISENIYEFIPHCVFDDSGGFFRLNTKHIVDFEKLENPDALLLPKPNPIEEQYRERYDIEIVGLKDEYALGEKYSFYFVVSGHGHECARINVSYPDEDGELVGWGQEPLCDANIVMHDFETSHDNRKELFGNVTIKKSGTYAVTVIFDQPSKYFPTTAIKEFQVIGD